MQKKISLFLLFFSLSFYGQNDTISVVVPQVYTVESIDTTHVMYQNIDLKTSNSSVVSLEKVNVVYRGLPNLISIAVPNCKSFTASGIGLYKYAEGKYQLLPGSGIESIIIIDIVLNDGSTKKEVHKFRIKNIPKAYGAINGLISHQSMILMSKEELKNATISIDFPKDFLYDLNINLKQFVVKIGNKSIVIEGTKFTKEVIDLIDKLPINSIFEIQDLKPDKHCDNCCYSIINPIKIMIIETINSEEN